MSDRPLDGCSRWQAIYRVILPITLPGVLTVADRGLPASTR
jgi:ABC-type maltose transport system permease subunit